MYLVYESLYGDLQLECDATNIVGLFKNKADAIKRVNEIIDSELKNGEYVLDCDRNKLEEDNYVRFFYKEQENWDCYYELFIEKMEVK